MRYGGDEHESRVSIYSRADITFLISLWSFILRISEVYRYFFLTELFHAKMTALDREALDLVIIV